MDIQRSILIVALAIVSYLMVLQWNQDYGQAALPTASAPAANTATLPDTATPAQQAANDDVPTAANTEHSAPAAAQVAPSNELIRVETDVLNLAIDPNGGDIVQLTLPKFPRRQDRPDVPFQLFDNGNERLYQAQSGLIGTNGPDARSSGRPLYSAAQRQYKLADGQDQLVVELTFSENGVNYVKRFTLTRGKYDLQVAYRIDNQSAQAWNGSMYAQLKRDGSADPSSSTATGVSTYLGAAVWTPASPTRRSPSRTSTSRTRSAARATPTPGSRKA